MRVISVFVAALERRLAAQPWFFRLYAYPYRALVGRELRLAGVGARDTVLNIGCGSLPFTAVLVAELSGARVIGVDCDREAVVNARATVARLGLRRRIRIIEADAARDPLPAADVAVVSLQAAPKTAIHANLTRALARRGGGRAVFRLPRPALEAEYETLSAPVAAHGVVRHRMPTFDRSELYLVAFLRSVA